MGDFDKNMNEDLAKNPLLLIVDDNPKNLQVLASILNSHNYRLAIANNGNKAIQSAINLNPDLILLDIMMPDIDGYEVCRQLKVNESTKKIPIIFLTAKTETEDLVYGFKIGAVDFLTKPFNQDELLVRIKNHLFIKFAQDSISAKNTELETLNLALIEAKDIIANEAEQLKSLNEKLAASEKNLLELNHTKDKFFSIISHDLRGPLGGVMSLIELVKTYYTSMSIEEIIDIINSVDQASRKTFDLLDNLLQWSRLHTGRMDFYPNPNDIFLIIDRSVKLLQLSAAKKHISLINEVPERSFAFFDANMLDLIVRNLISNAIKFTRELGVIRVSLNQISDKDGIPKFAEITIEDNGVGMNDIQINNLFRLDVSNTTVGTGNEIGTGLGLILVSDFVKRHQGEIKVESEENKGSKFMFSLPLNEFNFEEEKKFANDFNQIDLNSI